MRLLSVVMINQLGVKQLLKHADLAQHVSVDIRLFGNDLFDEQDALPTTWHPTSDIRCYLACANHTVY